MNNILHPLATNHLHAVIGGVRWGRWGCHHLGVGKQAQVHGLTRDPRGLWINFFKHYDYVIFFGPSHLTHGLCGFDPRVACSPPNYIRFDFLFFTLNFSFKNNK